MSEIVYFELNNWFCGEHYPCEEPFVSWMSDDIDSEDITIEFANENWVKENKLCVVANLLDMSLNFNITATREWVDANCPRLMTEFTQFLRYPDKNGEVYGRCESFLEYYDENIGVTWGEDY